MLLEAVGPALESVSWLWAVFHLGLSRNLLFKVFATIWSPGEELQFGIVGQALISVSGQGVMPYLGLLRPPWPLVKEPEVWDRIWSQGRDTILKIFSLNYFTSFSAECAEFYF